MLAKGCCYRVGGEGTPKGQKGSPRPIGLTEPTRSTNPGAQQGHAVVGKIAAPLGAQFRCVILTLALYQFVDEDRQ